MIRKFSFSNEPIIKPLGLCKCDRCGDENWCLDSFIKSACSCGGTILPINSGGKIMKKIRLLSMKLTNFKGIKDLSIELNGSNMDIYGDNATGKTTIADAFMWVLFGKDTFNRADFEIKTLDKDGQPYHGLDHSVKAALSVGGKEVVLQKIFKENWVKKRGEADRTLTGNTTDYYIDELPVKKGEYDSYIQNILDENLFKLITNVFFFNEQLSWKDRRQTLIDLCGDISDQDIIDSNAKLKRLSELITNNTVEEIRAKIRSKKKLLNEDIKAIPIRIDELTQSMPIMMDAEELEKTMMQKEYKLNQIADIDKSISAIDNEILQLSNVQAGWDNRNRSLANMKRRLSEMKYEKEEEFNRETNKLRIKLNNLTDDNVALEEKIRSTESTIIALNDKQIDLEARLPKLREQWTNIDNETFETPATEEFTCPTCGQELPEDMKENKLDGLKRIFDDGKRKRLLDVSSNGKNLSAEITELKAKIDKYRSQIQDYMNTIASNKSMIEESGDKIKLSHSVVRPEDPEIVKLNVEIKELELELANPDDSSSKAKDQLLKEKRDLVDLKKDTESEIADLNRVLSSVDQITSTNRRIDDLKTQERSLAEEIAKLEGYEFLTEEFIRTKVDMLESRINSKFKTVCFKLFNTQVNGALEETCEAMINGVPFSNANNAAKINAGIDIINTLTEYYGVQAPVFLDNSESINRIIESDCQLIRLVVSKDRNLRIETAGAVERIGA